MRNVHLLHAYLQISSNGLVSFGWPYLSWWPVPFPFGDSFIPVIAPYWADFDFRGTNISSSRIFYQIFYQVYTRESENNRSSPRVGDAVFDSFRQRLLSSSTAAFNKIVDFEPEWIVVIITWNEALDAQHQSGELVLHSQAEIFLYVLCNLLQSTMS